VAPARSPQSFTRRTQHGLSTPVAAR
jgi:hypothetical protein